MSDKTNSSEDTVIWVVLLAFAAYLTLWGFVNLAPSSDQIGYAFGKIGEILDGDHNIEGYLYIIVIISGIGLQIWIWVKNAEREPHSWEPVFWPLWLAAFGAITGFLASILLFGFSNAESFISPFWENGFIATVIGIVLGLIILLILGIFFAVITAIPVAAYSSVIIHFPIISLFTGIFVTLANLFENGSVNPLILYTNFLDMISLSNDPAKIIIAILSLLASLAAAILRGLTSVEIIDLN